MRSPHLGPAGGCPLRSAESLPRRDGDGGHLPPCARAPKVESMSSRLGLRAIGVVKCISRDSTEPLDQVPEKVAPRDDRMNPPFGGDRNDEDSVVDEQLRQLGVGELVFQNDMIG